MANRVAAGFVVFRKSSGVIQYLLLKASYGEKHWTPPKGHVDPGETDELVTAHRETQEECGLTEADIKVITDSKKEINYPVKGAPKRVVYWLAELTNPEAEIKLSNEHTEFKWLALKEACDHVKYENTCSLLTFFECYIKMNKL